MRVTLRMAVSVIGLAVAALLGGATPVLSPAGAQGGVCPGGGTGVTLPPGFRATVFADDVGNVRHIAMAAYGTVYANPWNGSSDFPRGKKPADGFLAAPRDTEHGGKADEIAHFGKTPAEGSRAARAAGSTRASSTPR